MGLKPDSWGTMSVQSKMAACMYPDKVPGHIQQEMLNVGGKDRAALQQRIDKGTAGDSRKPAVPAPSPYDRVPTLKRVEVKSQKSWWEK